MTTGNIINFQEALIQQQVEAIRPPFDLRHQIDFEYQFENHVLELFSVRPHYKDKTKITRSRFAKTRFIKSQGIWKIYWMRASGKWHLYDPEPEIDDIKRFFEIVKEDRYGCFFI